MAAGGSSRLDSPKQLLKWGDDFLINHIIHIVNEAEISPIYVVLGSRHEEIQGVLKNQSIHVLYNPDWRSGMSTSIKCALSALSGEVEAAFIFLSDQPFISSALLSQLMEQFIQADALIAAPRVGIQQCNPVLFSRKLFPELLTISGDRGAKSLLSKFPVEWVDWPDENLLLDIDSKEDYQTALGRLNF